MSILRSFWALMLGAIFLLSSLAMPGGDPQGLAGLPDMYRQCQAHEHQDMTLGEFVTDHLINIDGLMDAHGPGDAQRPHKPCPVAKSLQVPLFYVAPAATVAASLQARPGKEAVARQIWPSLCQAVRAACVRGVFRPPIG